MKTVLEMTSDETFIARNDEGHEAIIDTRAANKKNLSPMELTLSSLGACAGVDIISMLQKRRKNISRFTIALIGYRPKQHPRKFTRIECHYKVISPDINKEELAKITRLATEKYCSVAASLKATISFTVEVER